MTFTVTCGGCGLLGGAACEKKNARQRFLAIGWRFGKRDKDNRCPKCVHEIRTAAKKKAADKQEEKKQMNNIPPIKSTVVQMSRDDRRIIFEKLNDVYSDEKSGYSGDWTDARVASDLGVARAWVTSVRDEMFGPEGGNENIKKSIEEARVVLTECRKVAEMFTPLLGRADKIQKTLTEIERGLR